MVPRDDVAVVVVVDGVEVCAGITIPDLGSVISPIGLMIVGPTGAFRGTKMIPTIPAAMSTSDATVHHTSDDRLLVEVISLNVAEPGSNSLSSYARRRRRSTRPRPAMPKKRDKMLTMSAPPLIEEVAEPPRPVPGAPDGIVAGGMCGGVVGGPLMNVVVDEIVGTELVVVDVDVVVELVVVDVVPDGVVGIVVEVTGIVDVVVVDDVEDVVEVVDVGELVEVVEAGVLVEVVDVGVDEVVVVDPFTVVGVVGIDVVVKGMEDVVDEEEVVEVVVVDCELTENGSQFPVDPG